MGVYGRTSLNAQVEPWRWATETERHDRFQSRQTNTRNRSYHSLRITKVGNRRLAKRFSSYYFQCLLLNPDGRNNIYLKEHQSKDRSHLEWTVHADDDGGTMVWAIFSWHTLEPLVQKKDRLNAIPQYCGWPRAAVFCLWNHHLLVIEEHLWDVVEIGIRILNVQPPDLQLQVAIMTARTQISKEYLQKIVESMPRI